MPRRATGGGLVYHVLNRGAKRSVLFDSVEAYNDFEELLLKAKQRVGMRILAYCLMPNHWHLILYPCTDHQLPQFMHWLTVTHAQRWHALHATSGSGAVYQGRYKALPVQTTEYFFNVCRYVERNPIRAGLVSAAQQWRWSSFSQRRNGNSEFLDRWPIEKPTDWESRINCMVEGPETEQVRAAIKRNMPLGEDDWSAKTAKRLGLEATRRPIGRPRKLATQLPDGNDSRSLFP